MEQVAVLGDGTETATMNGTVLDPNRETLRPKLFIFNLSMTVAIMVLLILDLVPLSYLFMVGTAVALLVNFPKISDQAKMIASHASSVIAVVSMVLAAAVLTGVLSGTGMVEAMSAWLVDVIPVLDGPAAGGPHRPDLHPGHVLHEQRRVLLRHPAGAHRGRRPLRHRPAVDMARASITGQPVHMQSPLVPAILLLVSLSKVDLGEHHKKVLWRALVVSLVMLAVGVLTGAIGIG